MLISNNPLELGCVQMLKCPWITGPNWGSPQAPALQAITARTCACSAEGSVKSAAALPCPNLPLSCLSPPTAGKARSSQYVLEMCLATWNINFPAWQILWYLQTVQGRNTVMLEMILLIQPLMGEEGGGVCWDKSCWSSKSRFIPCLTGHCIIGAPGRTWSMIARTAWTINQWG